MTLVFYGWFRDQVKVDKGGEQEQNLNYLMVIILFIN